MKLRAPRCNDARSLTELPACQLSQSTGFCSSALACGAADSPACTINGNVPSARTLSRQLASLRMEGHPLRYGLYRIPARVPVHQGEERKIGHAADSRQRDIDALRRLQTQIHQSQKGDDEAGQE